VLDFSNDDPAQNPLDAAHAHGSLTRLHILEFIVIIVLAVAVGYLYVTNSVVQGVRTDSVADATDVASAVEVTTPMEQPSIAVLPFVNMSEDPNNEYFSDGISEELLDALAKLDTLRVAARTSSFTFKGINRDIREIGKALDVDTVLEGSVRKFGNEVRITAQLVNAQDGYHLWSETYDRELVDIFALQDEIAHSIVSALHLPLGLKKSEPLVNIGTQNIEAYNEYLRGLHFSKLFDEESFGRAIVHLNKAVALDPEYAAPYAVLGNIYSTSALWKPPEEVMPLAVQAFERALQLDPTQGLALVTKAQYLTNTQWDWMGAKEYFLKGLEDESVKSFGSFSYVTVHLLPVGAFAEASAVLADAEAIDPIDSRLKIASASMLMFQGDFPGAIATYELALGIDPANLQAAGAVCLAYVAIGDFASAENILHEWKTRVGYTNPWMAPCLVLTKQSQGDTAAAVSAYEELAAAAKHQVGIAVLAGDAAISLGRIDEALDWYELSLGRSEVGIMMIRTRLLGRPDILALPRMQAILDKMHLDDESLQGMGYLPNSVATANI
jgi:TolB-like protein/Flp pilus assembly protein TadD